MRIKKYFKNKRKISIMKNAELAKIKNETEIENMKELNLKNKKKSKKILFKIRINYLLIVLIKILLFLILFIPIFSEDYQKIYRNIGSAKFHSYRILYSSAPFPSKIVYCGNEISTRSYDDNQYYSSCDGNYICVTKNETYGGIYLYYSYTVHSVNNMFKDCDIISVNFAYFSDMGSISNMYRMFYGCTYLESVYNFDISNAEDMSSLFYNCNKLSYLSFSSTNYNKIKYMNSMFKNCESLTAINLKKFYLSNVENMDSIFYNCIKLKDITFYSGYKTKKLTNMNSMFYNCINLAYLYLNCFDTSQVSSMSYLFFNCEKLASLDLGGFDTSKVNSMNSMFYNCKKLASLDLANFDTHYLLI